MAGSLAEKHILPDMPLGKVLEGLPTFRPVAYYDKHLDVIRVQILDCSIWEDRLDRIMTVYHNNHHVSPNGVNDVVGFAIKGVRHLLIELGITNADGPIKIADLLNKLISKYPSRSTKFALEFYRASTQRPEVVEVDFRECA